MCEALAENSGITSVTAELYHEQGISEYGPWAANLVGRGHGHSWELFGSLESC